MPIGLPNIAPSVTLDKKGCSSHQLQNQQILQTDINVFKTLFSFLNVPSSRSGNVRSSPPWIRYIYIYDCCRLPLGNMPLKCWLMNFIVAQRLKHPLYRISKNSTSLSIHYCKGIVLEDLRGIVDFTMKLNVNDKQRGALSKLQNFIGN